MKPKVLVVDDDARTLRMMEAMLVSAGYCVILAENGNEAITKATESPPDIILLDVMMPEIDGFEVAKRLQTIIQTKDIPIVMVTALGEVKDRVKALTMGADDFLTKPVDKTELLTRVKTLVEKSERIKQLIVVKKRPLVPIVSVIVAAIMAVVSAIIIVTNKPVTVVEKQIEYQTEYVDVVREVVKEVIVEKRIEQREFSSKEELEEWLAEDDTNEYIYLFFDQKGVARQSDAYDCDDYALQLQRRAAESGFLMSVTRIRWRGTLHMVNLVTIGNDVHYVEPQTDEVRFYCRLD